MRAVQCQTLKKNCTAYLSMFALEGLKHERINRVGQVTHPLDCLPTGDKPDVIKGQNGVQEPLETLHIFGFIEPNTLGRKIDGCAVGIVMPGEILPKELVHILRIVGVGARVQLGTSSVAQVVPHDQGNLP